MLQLILHEDDRTDVVVPREQDIISIGSDASNVVRFKAVGVAPRHAVLMVGPVGLSIEVMPGAEPITVNGQMVGNRRDIRTGDEITIGACRIELRGGASVPVPVPVPEAPRPAPLARRASSFAVPRHASSSIIVLPDHAPGVVERYGLAREVWTSEPAPFESASHPISRLDVAAYLSPPQRRASGESLLCLVSLGNTLTGKRFPIDEDRPLSLGSAPDADIRVESPGVASYHVEVSAEGGVVVVRTLGGARNTTINGAPVHYAVLTSGDVLGVGQARFTAVGGPPGGSPHRATRSPRRAPWGKLAAVAAVVAGLGGLSLYAVRGTVDPRPTDSAGERSVYARALEDCHRALSTGAEADAAAFAERALVERPGDLAAQTCLARAASLGDDRRAFERGLAALRRGDPGAARSLMADISPSSPLRERSDVRATFGQLAAGRSPLAGTALAADPRGSSASSASAGPAEALDPEASDEPVDESYIDDSDIEGADVQAARKPSTHARAGAAEAVFGRTFSSTANAPSGDAWVPGAASQRGSQDDDVLAIKTATECLAEGDNACVIAALAGHTPNEPSLALLIETLLEMGNGAGAERAIRDYVQRYPDSPRAARYRALLD